MTIRMMPVKCELFIQLFPLFTSLALSLLAIQLLLCNPSFLLFCIHILIIHFFVALLIRLFCWKVQVHSFNATLFFTCVLQIMVWYLKLYLYVYKYSKAAIFTLKMLLKHSVTGLEEVVICFQVSFPTRLYILIFLYLHQEKVLTLQTVLLSFLQCDWFFHQSSVSVEYTVELFLIN